MISEAGNVDMMVPQEYTYGAYDLDYDIFIEKMPQ